MTAFQPPGIEAVTIKEAVSKMKGVDLDSDEIATARDLGISFGD